MDATRTSRLGDTTLVLTQLGFGGAPIGNFSTSVTEDEARGALEAAWSAGIRYFDTSPWYGLGLSEHRTGQFLRDKSPDEYVVSTKVGRLLKPWPQRFGSRQQRGVWVDPLDFEVRFDYSYEGILRSHEDSLQRLGLAEVDILYIHDLDRGYHRHDYEYQARISQLVNGGFAALRDLRTAGRIKAIGVGVNAVGVISDMLDMFDPDVFLVAGPHTLLRQDILETELPRCADAGISVVIGAAFAYGILATGVRNRDPSVNPRLDSALLRRAEQIEAACERYAVDLPAAALQYPAAHPTVTSVLFGAISSEQVAKTISWFESQLPMELWHELVDQGLLPNQGPFSSVSPPK